MGRLHYLHRRDSEKDLIQRRVGPFFALLRKVRRLTDNYKLSSLVLAILVCIVSLSITLRASVPVQDFLAFCGVLVGLCVVIAHFGEGFFLSREDRGDNSGENDDAR